MARTRTHIPLSVFMNGRLVGRLTKAPSGSIYFRYDVSWLDWQHGFPVSLSLPLREDRYAGAPVIAVFENLLPDSEEIRRRVAASAAADGTDAFSLLGAIGRDCAGAMQFLPDGIDPGAAGEIVGVAVDHSGIAEMVSELPEVPLGVRPGGRFRISLAGAQHKMALMFREGEWHIPSGSTPTTHILKPPIGLLDNGIDLSRSVENEHFCMKLLAGLGLGVANTEIVDFESQRVLVVERFDRLWTRDGRLLRIPQEDCCQALSVPPTRRYQADGGPGIEELLELFKASDRPEDDRSHFLKAQIVFWLIGATDGHAKNFSIFLHTHGGFTRTPLYDVISIQPNLDARQLRFNQARMAMSAGSNRHYTLHTILPRHYVQTARAAGLPAERVLQVMDDIEATLPRALEDATGKLPDDFPDSVTSSIVLGIEQRSRLLAFARGAI